jgi:AraC family transcriptional regulator, regulatory protein of adaptative response / DNA-3-methyladenine glycosylase II
MHVALELPFHPPLDIDGLLVFLQARAVPGVEEITGDTYRRSVRLPRGAGVVSLTGRERHVEAVLDLEDARDLDAGVERCRWLLDLAADPAAIAERLGADPVLGPLVTDAPGRRVPGAVDGGELAVRAVLGQQVSVASAVTVAQGLVAEHGEPLAQPIGTVTRLFPTPGALAAIAPDALPMPRSRARALNGLASTLASGELTLNPRVDVAEAERHLLALPGIGPWTVAYIAMRALRDPDAFLPTDLGVRHALERLGHDGRPAAATRLAEGWRPYRAYATQYLWGHLTNGAPPAFVA